MNFCQMLIKYLFFIGFIPVSVLAQESKIPALTVGDGAIPVYPSLARAANIEGEVRVMVVTDGTKVVTAKAQNGHPILAEAAEKNALKWQYSIHTPVSFVITYRYRLDTSVSPNTSKVVLNLPAEVNVSRPPLVFINDSATP